MTLVQLPTPPPNMSNDIASIEYARRLDQELPGFQSDFAYPTLKSLGSGHSNESALYFCGNSLGLMPKATEDAVQAELDAWKQRGVVSHFRHPSREPWVSIDVPVNPLLVDILGAEDVSEVAIMNTLTGNLHAMLSAFYRPSGKRTKLIFEAKAFPSDCYAFEGQVKLHGLDPTADLVAIAPREGEYTLRDADVINTIEKYGDEVCLVILSGIQYYTGQFFNIPAITDAGHKVGAVVGWDLAHAVGNVELKLHDWNVDFAVFCTYKYLNSGPGSIGGIYVHSKFKNDRRPRLAGWWGNNPVSRFQMDVVFDPIPGAAGFRMSNPSVLNTVCLGESLKVFAKAGGMSVLRQRSISLTGYLQRLLEASEFYVKVGEQLKSLSFTIITPLEPDRRGAQLSLLFFGDGVMRRVFAYLEQRGVIGDERQPNVIRLAPNHLYNTHEEVLHTVEILNEALDVIKQEIKQ